MFRLVLSSLLVAVAPTLAASQQAPHDSVRGAVRVVDARARTLEVTTGVGMALRVVRLQVPAAVPVTTSSAGSDQLALSDLKPGDVVRVTFGNRTGALVAYTIERIGRMATGVIPSP
ncbi:MAG TPA: hypothetical protein VGJ80_09620 [Gemmatimonadales bacterium]|jgi:hypothetical protein